MTSNTIISTTKNYYNSTNRSILGQNENSHSTKLSCEPKKKIKYEISVNKVLIKKASSHFYLKFKIFCHSKSINTPEYPTK